MKILYKLTFLFLAFALVACTSTEETLYTVKVSGSEVYKRHLARGTAASLDCYVYASEASVSVDFALNLPAYDNATMNMTMVTEVGDPTRYTADIWLSGILMSEYAETCEAMTKSFEEDGGKVWCKDPNIHGEIKLRPVTEPTEVQYVVTESIEEGKEKCDNLFYTYKDFFVQFEGEWDYGTSDDVVEKAVSCDVTMENDTVSMKVVYSDKSLTMETSMQDSVTFYTTEEYTGIDDQTLSKICIAHQNDEDIFSMTVACNGPWFAYSHSAVVEEQTVTLEDLAVQLKKKLCPVFLNGSHTLDEMWN